jgi:2-dehydro-3-deoxyphosphooctonate aldolase (KDO 8-P synthase)
MAFHPVAVDSVTFGDPQHLVLIGGPCVIESEEHAMGMAEKISQITKALNIAYVFKASFDKANRSSIKSYRGPGMEKGLKILGRIKKEFKVPLLTDIHNEAQARPVAEVVDILQIPAFLCRQTDLLIAAAKTGKIVNVKKGQFLSPWDVKNIVTKLVEAGTQKILLTERGSSFGYNNLINDFRSIPIMRSFGYPVVFDATHSVQLPGGKGDASGGMAEFIPVVARCGVVAGADALFMEIHDHPERALSDGPNNLHLNKLKDLLENLVALKKAMAKSEEILV